MEIECGPRERAELRRRVEELIDVLVARFSDG